MLGCITAGIQPLTDGSKNAVCLCKIKEMRQDCRQSIVDHHAWCGELDPTIYKGMPCVFGDLCGVMPEGLLDEGSFIQKVVAANRSMLARDAYCYTHNRLCPLWPASRRTTADVEVAGLPCPDFSRAGRKRREEGPTNKVFISHAKRHVELGTPLIVIENVWDTGKGACGGQSLGKALNPTPQSSNPFRTKYSCWFATAARPSDP